MEEISFRKALIESFVGVCKTFQLSPLETTEDADSLIETIKNIDREKGKTTRDFIKSLINLHKSISKETEIPMINKKCESVRNAYREEDYDTADGIVDELKQAKDKLVCFVRKAANNEHFKQIGKEPFELIVDIIRDSMDDELGIRYVITRLFKVILSSLI